jgi:hypothetical protein
MRVFFFISCTIEMDVVEFEHFARTERGYTGTCGVVDVCMDAMEEGTLSVIAKQWGYCLWEFYIFRVDQWARVCALLQRNQLPPSLLWELTYVRYIKRNAGSGEVDLVSQCPDAMAALLQIEFLWQDLDAVQAWLKSPSARCNVEWVAAEVARRRQWFTGLRRAWLSAVVTATALDFINSNFAQ